MILYKYRQNSPFTDQIFTEGKVWLAKSVSLNDPCECTLHSLAPEWISKKVTEMKRAQIAGFLVGMPGTASDPLATEFSAKLRPIEDFEEKYRAFRKMYEQRFQIGLSDPEQTFSQLDSQLKDVGIFSLSESADHPLMWSHYAGNHEGVCLGFEAADRMPMSDRKHFIKVTYTDRIPKMEHGFLHQIAFSVDAEGRRSAEARIPLSDETLRAAISTKSKCWKYEREWRYVQMASGAYLFPGPLVEIVFGFRCAGQQREHYRELAAAHIVNDVRLFEMRRISNSFVLERVFIGTCASKCAARAPTGQKARMQDEASLAEEYPELQRQLEAGKFEQALPAIDEALKKNPRSFRLWRAKGVALGSMLRHGEALTCFDKAIELNPRFFSAWYHRGVACMSLEQYEEAVSAYKEARKLNPSDASTCFNLGIVLAHLGRLEEAKPNLIDAEKAGHPRARDILHSIK